jgi:hypothetical protein
MEDGTIYESEGGISGDNLACEAKGPKRLHPIQS